MEVTWEGGGEIGRRLRSGVGEGRIRVGAHTLTRTHENSVCVRKYHIVHMISLHGILVYMYVPIFCLGG